MSPPRVRNVTEASPAAPTPAAKAAQGVEVVTDSLGRKIGFRKLKPSQRFLLAENVQVKTESAEMQAVIVASVVNIDEDGLPPLESRAELLQRLDELGDEGLRAITGPIMAMYGVSFDAKDIDLAKNS